LKNYNEIIGFAAYENNYLNQLVTRYTNFYLKPMERICKLLLDRIALLQSKTNGSTMSLNVNRFNTALLFYQKLGFIIVREENIELDQGYIMEDYVMEKVCFQVL
jgi:hypothetical protein